MTISVKVDVLMGQVHSSKLQPGLYLGDSAEGQTLSFVDQKGFIRTLDDDFCPSTGFINNPRQVTALTVTAVAEPRLK